MTDRLLSIFLEMERILVRGSLVGSAQINASHVSGMQDILSQQIVLVINK
jgi:hypothetical protein